MISHRRWNGEGTASPCPHCPPDCEILALTLLALHGKNEVKSRWCPSLLGRAIPPLVAMPLRGERRGSRLVRASAASTGSRNRGQRWERRYRTTAARVPCSHHKGPCLSPHAGWPQFTSSVDGLQGDILGERHAMPNELACF